MQKNSFYKMTLCCIVLSLILLSCRKEEININQEVSLKRKLEFDSKTSVIPKARWEYHYDAFQRLSHVIQNDHIETRFIYDDENKLINKKSFYLEDNYLIDSTVYLYSYEELTEEVKYNKTNEPYRTIYEYNNSNITKKTEYRGDKILTITIYEYNNGLCIREVMNNGRIDTQFITHQYSDNELIVSSVYVINPNANTLIQQIFYTYDEEGNLILEESIQMTPELVNDLNYIFVYKYEAI